jgi:PII-like signaling protein
MKGYQITFFTQQDHRHHGKPLSHWLLELAREMALPGATIIAGAEGFGHQRRIHSAHFFELADQPQEIQIAASEADAERLFDRLKAEQMRIFYVKSAVEFGVTGEAEP